MDSFARAKLKSENGNLRTQLEELNHKLDDQSYKYYSLISFINLKNNLIKAAKINEKEHQIELFINQFIMNNQNNETLKKIFPSGCQSKDRYRYYRDCRELYNRVVDNSTI